MHHAVRTSRSYQTERPAVLIRSPNAILKEWFAANREHMRTKAIVSFKALIRRSENWTNK